MKKIVAFIMVFFFISGSFIVAVNPVSASESEDSWYTKKSMVQARGDLGVAVWDGKIYAIGGHTAVGQVYSYVDTTERYDPKKDTWVTLQPMPTPRAYFAIAACQGKIYCIGGYSFETDLIFCSVNEVYDIVTDSWSIKSSIPLAVNFCQAYVVNEQIFVSDGSVLYAYDSATDLWTNKISMPTGIVVASYVVDNKIVHAVERRYPLTESNPTGAYEQVVLVYDPDTNSWSKPQVVPPIFGGFVVGVTTGVYAPKNVYNFNFAGATGNVVCEPLRGTWTNAKDIPTFRRSFGVAVVDDVLYVIGGMDDRWEATSLNEQYFPIGYSSVPIGPEPSDPSISSEFSVFELFLKYFLVVSLVITGIVVSCLFYFKKRAAALKDKSKNGVT